LLVSRLYIKLQRSSYGEVIYHSYNACPPRITVKYRSRMDIVADMLEIAQDGAIKTRIMYRGFLSFPQLKDYLVLLTDSGLLDYTIDDRKYHTTERGRRFLKIYGEVGHAIAPKQNKPMMH
jgi:predicted transcriptional regulator